MSNIDPATVSSFGDEWARYDQSALGEAEHRYLFDKYFAIFPWDSLPDAAHGFDMGCGSGRWAILVAPRIGKLTCIDPAPEALDVARRNMKHLTNVEFINSGVADGPLPANTQDFGYSLGVLHHVPDTRAALIDCVKMLKPGAPFLVYLYYRFDNRPFWYVMIWRLSEYFRRFIMRLPPAIKSGVTDAIATVVYFPLARAARLFDSLGWDVSGWVLSSYRNTSFYTMRTDARDRFGTPLEQRFTRAEIEEMMRAAGLCDVRFSEDFPFWCAVGRKSHTAL